MSDETTLLPCPFCGGEAQTHETIDGWIASCSSEQNELDGFTHNAQAYGMTESEAIAAWNTRAELRSDRDAMTDHVERFCGEYADLLKKAEGLEPLSDEFGKLEREETRMVEQLVDSLAALGSGTLTAEQAREAIMSVDRWEKPMGNTGLTNTHLIIRDDGWQAIADELNAELGSGTCRISASSTDGLCSDNPRQRFELSCGHSFIVDGLGAPVACPVCGKAVGR